MTRFQHWDLIGRIVGNIILGGLVGFNVYVARRNRRLIAREIIPLYVQSIRHFAEMICPMCSAAAGRGDFLDEDGPIKSATQINGYHSVRLGSGEQIQLPCPAVEMHAFAHNLEHYAKSEAGKGSWRKSRLISIFRTE